jgi:hypothetical protein
MAYKSQVYVLNRCNKSERVGLFPMKFPLLLPPIIEGFPVSIVFTLLLNCERPQQ